MPLFFEHLADQQAQNVLVLHQQNYTGRCVNLLLRRPRLRAGLPGIVAAGPGQVEVDAGALLRFADNAQLAAGLAHETIHDRQAKAGTVAQWFGGKEGLERSLQDVGGHANAGVADTQMQVGAAGQVHCACLQIIEPGVFAGNAQRAPLRHGITGIDAQIEQCVLQLVRVDAHQPLVAQGLVNEGDARVQRAGDQFMHACHQLLHIYRLRHQCLLARKRQQPLNQRGCPLSVLPGEAQ